MFQYIHNLVKDILYNYRPDKIQQVIDDFDKNRKASDIKYNKIDTKGYTDILAKAAMGMFLAVRLYCYKNDCDKGKMKKISDGLSSGYEQHKDKLDYGMKIIAGTAAGKMAYDEAKAKKKGIGGGGHRCYGCYGCGGRDTLRLVGLLARASKYIGMGIVRSRDRSRRS